MAASDQPVGDGRTVALVAALAPAMSSLNVPGGTVIFNIDGNDRPSVAVSRGIARIEGVSLGAGSHTVIARYSGDSNFDAGGSPSVRFSAPSTWAAPFQARGIDVTQHGLVGNGVTDNATAFENLLNTTSNGRLFYFPRGTYNFSRTIDLTRYKDWGFIGEVDTQKTPISIIRNTTANTRVVSADYFSQGGGTGSFKVKNIGFVASASGGVGFYSSNSVMAAFDNVSFAGHIGQHALNPFSMAMRNVSFVGPGGAVSAGHIGFLGMGVTSSHVDAGTLSGWGEGMRLAGAGLSVSNSTFSRNGIGLNLGSNPSGQNFIYSRSAINDNTFIDNDTAIDMKDVASSYFANNSIQGTANAPSGQSAYGVKINYIQLSDVAGLRTSGGFTAAAVALASGDHTHFYNSDLNNSIGTGKIWDVPAGLTGLQIIASDMPNRIPEINPVLADTAVALNPAPGVINVVDRGLVGDGVRDNTSVLQSLINSAENGTTFYFPVGDYFFGSTVDFSRLSSFTIQGELSPYGGPRVGTALTSDFAGPLLNIDYGSGSGSFAIRDVKIAASSRTGAIGVYARNPVLSSLRNVKVQGDTGIKLVNAAHTTMRSVNAFGSGVGVGTGIVVSGGVGNTMDTVDLVANQEGIRVSGTQFALYSSRFEVNRLGMNLGVNEAGQSAPLQWSSASGVSMEANDNAVQMDNCSRCSLGAMVGQGSTNAPSGKSATGMQMRLQNSTLFASGMNGLFSNFAFRILSGSSNSSIINSSWQNGEPGGRAFVNDSNTATVAIDNQKSP